MNLTTSLRVIRHYTGLVLAALLMAFGAWTQNQNACKDICISMIEPVVGGAKNS